LNFSSRQSNIGSFPSAKPKGKFDFDRLASAAIAVISTVIIPVIIISTTICISATRIAGFAQPCDPFSDISLDVGESVDPPPHFPIVPSTSAVKRFDRAVDSAERTCHRFVAAAYL
jgi:hypothetical protein